MDLGEVREFPIRKKDRFEACAEFFNALNHTNYGTPNRFINTATFGSITEASDARPRNPAQRADQLLSLDVRSSPESKDGQRLRLAVCFLPAYGWCLCR
jgi:hypothetical protein